MPQFIQFDLLVALDSFVRLAVAFVLVLPVALEREKADKPLGLRTFPLVAVASTAFVMVGKVAFAGDLGSQARIIQGLITGIGFLGGGAILKQGLDVRGTATAASIWSTAARGAAGAYDRYEIAVVLALVNFFVLRSLKDVTDGVGKEVDRIGNAVADAVNDKSDD